MSDSDFKLSEYDAIAARYGHASFEEFLARDFVKYNEATRAAVLQRWDELMDAEIGGCSPTRETAQLLTRRRQLNDLHWQLRKAGR